MEKKFARSALTENLKDSMAKTTKKPILRQNRQPEIELVNGEFPNTFSEMFIRVNNIPVIAREHICKACDWSTPTFYRKLRTTASGKSTGDGKVRNISNAEMISIKAIYVKIFEEALADLKAININTAKK